MDDLKKDFLKTNLLIEEGLHQMNELVRQIHEENKGKEDQPISDKAKSLGLELVATCKKILPLIDSNAEKFQKMSAIIREMLDSFEEVIIK